MFEIICDTGSLDVIRNTVVLMLSNRIFQRSLPTGI
jgi:hypothetical protein